MMTVQHVQPDGMQLSVIKEMIPGHHSASAIAAKLAKLAAVGAYLVEDVTLGWGKHPEIWNVQREA